MAEIVDDVLSDQVQVLRELLASFAALRAMSSSSSDLAVVSKAISSIVGSIVLRVEELGHG